MWPQDPTRKYWLPARVSDLQGLRKASLRANSPTSSRGFKKAVPGPNLLPDQIQVVSDEKQGSERKNKVCQLYSGHTASIFIIYVIRASGFKAFLVTDGICVFRSN